MAGHTVVVMDFKSFSQTDLLGFRRAGNKYASMHGVVRLAKKLMAAINNGSVRIQHGSGASVRASQTVGCDQSDAVDGTDELAFLGVTLAVEASPANQNEFEKGDNDIEFAANLAACINAHTTLSKYVSAVSDGVDEVTITFHLPGAAQNFIPITETGNGFTLGGATFADGAGLDYGTVDAFSFGG